MRAIRALLLFGVMFVVYFSFSGCASDAPKNFSVTDRSQIKTLELDEEIELPASFDFYALKRPIDVRSSDYKSGYRSEKYQILAAMGLWEVDLKSMVVQKVKEVMKNTGRFTFVEGYDGLFSDAKLKIQIRHYGMDQVTDLKDALFPTLAVDLIITEGLSSRVWKGSGELYPNARANQGYRLDEYRNNWKHCLDKAWANAVSRVVTSAVKDLITQ